MTPEETQIELDKLKCCVIVPTYNNEKTLNRVIDGVLNYCKNVIVVCDGATDSSLDILKQYEQKIELLSYTPNRGKGNALRQGFKHATKLGFDYAITIDSDGQHYPKDIPNFIASVIARFDKEEYFSSVKVGRKEVEILRKKEVKEETQTIYVQGTGLSKTVLATNAVQTEDIYGNSVSVLVDADEVVIPKNFQYTKEPILNKILKSINLVEAETQSLYYFFKGIQTISVLDNYETADIDYSGVLSQLEDDYDQIFPETLKDEN